MPGQPGTKKLSERYGDRLVCVRYLYDDENRRRVTTVELVVDDGPWSPGPRRPAPDPVVGIRTDWDEPELEARIAAAGGVWDRRAKAWRLRRSATRRLGLADLRTRLVPLPPATPRSCPGA